VSNNPIFFRERAGNYAQSDRGLPARITRQASKQTYYTINFLVDRNRIIDAFRAYAYFRWVDDRLDQTVVDKGDRQAFIARQRALMECSYRDDAWSFSRCASDLSREERMLVELIRTDQAPDSGLCSYIQNMMAVMVFDANRRGRLISQEELASYTQHLATAVTDAVYYFIGHDQPCPQDKARYLPTAAAHIVHMLRDTYEDTAAGYFNVPREFVESYHLDPCDIENNLYSLWVKHRVQLARDYFEIGKSNLAKCKNWRQRIAGNAYIARFEGVLNTIEREDYHLRPSYHALKNVWGGLRMGWSVLEPEIWRRGPVGYQPQAI